MSGNTLRIAISTQGLEERTVNGIVEIANGGVGVYIYQLIRHLLDHDDSNQYFLIRLGQGELDIYHHPRVHSIFLPDSQRRQVLAILGWQYARLWHRLNLDLIHFPNQFGGALMPRTMRRVASLHDLTPLKFPHLHPWKRVMAYRTLARIALRRSARVIVPSRATADDAITAGVARPGQIVMITDGINPALAPALAPALPPAPGQTTAATNARFTRPFILTVGVLEPRKNHILLLEVIRRLRQAGHEIDLVIVGRAGWHWHNPLEDPEWSDLRSWVHILSNLPDAELGSLYRQAAVFAYPSFYEGFGLPLLEAMYCGVPVVASSAPAMPEVAGSAALFADPRDAPGFTAQVKRLLTDPTLRERMIAAGRRRAASFSWAATAQATLAVYREVCADRSMPGMHP